MALAMRIILESVVAVIDIHDRVGDKVFQVCDRVIISIMCLDADSSSESP